MKAMVGLVILLLVVFTLVLFWPSEQESEMMLSSNEAGSEIENDVLVSNPQNEVLPLDENLPGDELRTQLMKAEYDKLAKARTNLKRRLGRLKHELWGLKFSAVEAKEINGIMMGAHKLIKNPSMLGAFSNVDGIENEFAKVMFADRSLDTVSTLIEEYSSEKSVSD